MKKGQSLSVDTVRFVLRSMNVAVTVHGFRSAFRDWAGECTHFPREVAEAALAHQIGNEVERAYRRGDALEKRRGLMEAWALYILPATNSSVIHSRVGYDDRPARK